MHISWHVRIHAYPVEDQVSEWFHAHACAHTHVYISWRWSVQGFKEPLGSHERGLSKASENIFMAFCFNKIGINFTPLLLSRVEDKVCAPLCSVKFFNPSIERIP